ncbi:MAG: hypothetical protein OEY24_01575 [Candidatus Bathyarchaeota archaeon]|nr:hypothetical protein [Candidatus Bathyarchaeota archaeon]MDH5494378.1 hypothetical protein [Candidatus Bathyarchaeota archaeon]
MVFYFSHKPRKLKTEKVERFIKKLAKKHNVPVPRWRIVGETPKSDRIEKTVFGPKTTFERKTVQVGGAFLMASDRTCCIEFYGLPTKETVEHEFRHYVDWLHGTLRREKIW